jgi:O-antigen/teichoic acid export membrane protein
MTGVRRAALYSMGQKYVAFVIQLGMTMVVARLLTPGEVGVFALGAAVSAIAQMLREFGVSSYVISQKDIDRQKLRAAFTVMTLTAGSAGVVLLALAWPLAQLYGETGVGWVLAVLSLNFFLLPLGVVPTAQLTKALRFRALFWLQTMAGLASAAVTVGFAAAGHSFMSLAYGSVAGNIVTVLGLAVLFRQDFLMPPTRHGLREVVRFGGSLTLGRIADQLAHRSNEVIVSGALGFHAAGLLSKSVSLTNSFSEFFGSGLTQVAMPALAKVRHEGGSVVWPFIKGTELMAPALWIFFGVLGVYAHEVINLLFGPQWQQCVPLLQVLCAFSLFWGPYMLAQPLIISMGLVGPLLRVQLLCAPLMILAIWVGAQFSLIWVVILPSAIGVLRLALVQHLLSRHCGVTPLLLMRALAGTAAACLALIALAAALRWLLLLMGLPGFVIMALGGGGSLFAAFALAAWRNHPVWQELVRARPSLARLAPKAAR